MGSRTCDGAASAELALDSTRSVTGLLCWVLLASCVREANPVDGGAAGLSVFTSEAATGFAPLFCEYGSRCCSKATEDCVGAAARALVFLGDLQPEFDAGGLTIDPLALDRCRADLAAIPCDRSIALLSVPSCRAVLVGHRQLGELCVRLGCATGLACEGHCEAVAGVGGACDAGTQQGGCIGGICQTSGCEEGLLCLQGTCRPRARVGEACSPAVVRCDQYVAYCGCADLLRGCVDGGTCTQLLPADAGCLRLTQCSSAVCTTGRCASDVGDFRCK